ncbi:hypothetical protein EUGRSUZ_C00303 [Eucalyptus grandis]|uniref:Uncharacterized protein n=2 Tax=Eucalyptus grandis TaxID=71139 RepID=A0ACC3LC21_EUCGR|nr:hypothetical protein EUGRSUZ_C00303 [Eucalyptus grandis]
MWVQPACFTLTRQKEVRGFADLERRAVQTDAESDKGPPRSSRSNITSVSFYTSLKHCEFTMRQRDRGSN